MAEHDSSDGLPRVTLSKELRRELCLPWKQALIGLQGRLDFIDIGYRFFVAWFGNSTDYMHVLLDGPWKIFDNYLVIQRWQPEFDPLTAKLSKMAVWVRLPRFAVEYFREDIIKRVLENVGKPLKIDCTTVEVERGKFARAAVEIDLDKPLVTHVWVRDKWRPVEYEGLHVVCFNCGTVGHREQSCPLSTIKTTDSENMDRSNPSPTKKDGNPAPCPTETVPPVTPATPRYGSWMLVTRKSFEQDRRKNPKPANQKTQTTNVKGNSFGALQDADDEGCDVPKQSNVKDKAEQAKKGKGKTSSNATARGGNVQVSQRGSKQSKPQQKERVGGGNISANATGNQPKVAQKSTKTSEIQSMDMERDPNTSNPCPLNTSGVVHQGKARGIRQVHYRGAYRGGGRGGRGPTRNYATDDIWKDNNGLAGIFKFGSSQVTPLAQDHTEVFTNGVVPVHSFTSGEDGSQTSPPATISP
ncbi:uncharacterized protein LOC115996049 [Ipomoea triloba]|uniref:uncharacterized protein LOC115996049 n=1 Tax=Ipomoea triloba TaxID=35885 RepID=UPI00125D17CA|nr:uncharacterized protein LOC115996049 [Ipomoea triloba]